MKLNVLYNNHPEDVKKYDTQTLRDRFLVEQIFVKDEVSFSYSHHDRFIFGGVLPVDGPVVLPVTKDLGTNYFLERREMGIINVGGDGFIEVDGKRYDMVTQDGLYLSKGTKDVV